MPSMEEHAKRPRQDRLEHLTRTPDELAAATRGKSDVELSRRPDAKNWAAKEVVSHLRDTEELFMTRLETIVANDEPRLAGLDPDRWAHERQYLRNDASEALAAFRGRRQEMVAFFRALEPAQWTRGGLHPVRGRFTIDDFLTLIAWHDDNHLDQLKRALEGRA